MEPSGDPDKRKEFLEKTFLPAHPMVVNDRSLLTGEAHQIMHALYALKAHNQYRTEQDNPSPTMLQKVIDAISEQTVHLDQEYEDAEFAAYLVKEELQKTKTELEEMTRLYHNAHHKLAELNMHDRP